MPTGLLEILSNTDLGRKIKEEKDRALASAVTNALSQGSQPNAGLFDLSALKDWFQPVSEEERQRIYKQAALAMIGSALGGALAKALGADERFAAGLTKGGLLIGQDYLQGYLEREKMWQDFKNKLATKLIITNLEFLADQAKDEQKRGVLKSYADHLRSIYPKYCKEDGSFDWVGFSHEATLRALELGLEPKTTKEIQEAFLNASKTLTNLEKSKAQILESLARSALNLAQVEKAKATAAKTKKETELLGKPTPPKVVIYRSEKEKGETGLSPTEERRILDRAIQLAQKDTRWITAESEEERWELVRDYYNRLKELLGRKTGKTKKTTAVPEEMKITGETLYQILFGE